MSEQLTICTTPKDGLIVVFGKEKAARLEWQAAGIEVYLKGAYNAKLYACAANLAICECQSRNIPTLSLRRVSK